MDNANFYLKEEKLNTCAEFTLLSQACQLIADAENKRVEAYTKAAQLFMTGGRNIGIHEASRRLGRNVRMVADDVGNVWSGFHHSPKPTNHHDTMIKIQDNAIQSTEINEETEENPETCLDGSDGVVNQYEEDECQKLHLLKMAVVDILDRMEITLPRITCERASKGSHFGTSWVDFKSLNPEEIVKERILNNVDIPLLEEKGAMSTCTQSTENSESGDADRGTTDMYEITAVSLMADVNVIAIDNFKRTEKNQISLRRGMVLKQVLAANQDGFAHGYSTSGLFCSPKKYGYYPACKVVLYKTDV